MVTVQTAYGFKITAHPAYASKFQKFFALLKERGYKVPAHMTKCWAPHGTHVAGSNHYIGAACDIQTGWNRGPEFVYHMDEIVKRLACTAACTFRDCGHVEAVRGTHNERPFSTPRWKNSNRSNRQQTISHADLLHEVDVEARSETSLSDLSAVHAPASHYE